MRSILQEASSIPKAIEKAWNEAGMPEEFTIKIFDSGEKNFLGFTKRPSVVSIVFDSRKVAQKVKGENWKFEREDRSDNNERSSYDNRRSERYSGRSQSQGGYRRQPEGQYRRPYPEKRYEDSRNDNRDEDNRPGSYQDSALWNKEAVEDVRGWLKEITTIMNLTIPFTAYADNHLLRIEFEKPACDIPSDERMLFSSFAYILMQFLKRKHKRKFKACRLAISSRR
jgi:predicted RNA-binding protein Jag